MSIHTVYTAHKNNSYNMQLAALLKQQGFPVSVNTLNDVQFITLVQIR